MTESKKERKRRLNREAVSRYRIRHRERILEARRKAEQTPEGKAKSRAKNVLYNKLHRDKKRAAEKKWLAEHPDYMKEKNRSRRARLNGAEGSHTEREWRDLCERVGNRCVYESLVPNHPVEYTLTQDHAVALSKGGTDCIDNIVPCCKSCNSRKKDRPLWDFLAEAQSWL